MRHQPLSFGAAGRAFGGSDAFFLSAAAWAMPLALLDDSSTSRGWRASASS